jgi:hypothetical protein
MNQTLMARVFSRMYRAYIIMMVLAIMTLFLTPSALAVDDM